MEIHVLESRPDRFSDMCIDVLPVPAGVAPEVYIDFICANYHATSFHREGRLYFSLEHGPCFDRGLYLLKLMEHAPNDKCRDAVMAAWRRNDEDERRKVKEEMKLMNCRLDYVESKWRTRRSKVRL